MKTVSDIRREFLDFFGENGHQIVQSSPLVPQNDPTLMFANAGMVQFKDIFTGKETRDYKRATTSQKCVRAGGKHNDLDNVGYTARHHTFFEMLGNFSFGDYFKEEAISFAWNLLTGTFGLPKDKLLVTVYHTDDEAADLWKKIAGLSDDRIIRIPTSDNFWMMGDTGPCGPCSEIFYDHGEHVAGGPPGSPEEDGDRFIEVWNLVFMQYEQLEDGSRIDLPNPCIDTGMGLERIAAILQGKHNNYDIDLLRSIIEQSADFTSQDAELASHKVIADHLRSSAFMLADGVMPSNEGRGYVLRRIMRRGMRHARLLGSRDPLMYRLFPTLLTKMGDAYPELRRAEALITETLKNEELQFGKTLDRGMHLLDDAVSDLGSGKILAGDVAFKLYDTYGFPLDLTQDALRPQGLSVDVDGFNAAMDKQKAEARAAWSGSGDAALEKVWFDVEEKIGATEFLGYATDQAEGQVTAILKDGKIVDAISKGDEAYIITNQTPFYGESGGQIGDTGRIITADGARFVVSDTQKKLGKLMVHIGTLEFGRLKMDDAVELSIDNTYRNQVRANHSATHLLHAALHEQIGEHVTQKGSLVASDRLRFDISLSKALTSEQLAALEQEVNARIRANTSVATRLMDIDTARDQGATALFGEKYDDEVRVVSMGGDKEDVSQPWSMELCGGTHVKRTGDIGAFKIVSESAVSSGVRRIEALTGQAAIDYMEAAERRLIDAAALLKSPVNDVPKRVASLIDERKKMEREISDLRRKLAAGGGASNGGDGSKDINGVKFAARVLEDIPAKELKPMVDDLKAQLGSGVVTLIAVNEGKASIVVGVTDDLTKKISAVDLVRVGSEALGGKGGGGRPDMAQAGGPNGSAANDAVNAVEKVLAS